MNNLCVILRRKENNPNFNFFLLPITVRIFTRISDKLKIENSINPTIYHWVQHKNFTSDEHIIKTIPLKGLMLDIRDIYIEYCKLYDFMKMFTIFKYIDYEAEFVAMFCNNYISKIKYFELLKKKDQLIGKG